MQVIFGDTTLSDLEFVKGVVSGDIELRYGDILYELTTIHQINLLGQIENFFMFVFSNTSEFSANGYVLEVTNE